MAKTDVATKESAEVAVVSDEEAVLIAANQSEADASDFQIPMLKITQGLTTEVTDGDARPGEFLNSLTRETYGKEVQFVVAAMQKGRFDHGVRGETKARKAYNAKTVPWKDDPFYGRPFTEHPDAEERYSERVNAGELEWGKGPRISTTYDFYGYIVNEDTDEPPIPVCLSLMRTNRGAARKWITLLNAVLRGRFWDAVFELTLDQQRNNDGTFFTLNVKKGRKTTSEERMEAVTIAQAVRALNVEVVGDDESEGTKPVVEPDAAGGMAV